MSSVDECNLRRVRQHGEVMLGADGYYGVPGKYWGISQRDMKRLADRGLVVIERVGQSAFAKPAPAADPVHPSVGGR